MRIKRETNEDEESQETRIFRFFNSRLGRLQEIKIPRKAEDLELKDLANDEFFFKKMSPPPRQISQDDIEVFSPVPIISYQKIINLLRTASESEAEAAK